MRARYPLKKVKCEVNSCIDKWKTIFEDHFDEKIEYAYAKGSGIKVWDSPIDYVPSLSDVDIHVKLRKNAGLFNTPDKAFDEAVEISGRYEEMFLEENPNPVHVPRTQIVMLDRALEDPDFLLPMDPDDIHVMIGKPELRRIKEEEKIRATDYKLLMRLESLLHSLPFRAIDKIGLDYWYLIHTLAWNVSPTPVRLLTQIVRKPEEVWGWNRTAICRKLEEQGFTEVSRRYKEYYLSGWEMFYTNFRDSQVMRDVIIKAYRVLKSSFNEAKRIKSI
jgi:hypothetical protein